MEDRNKRESLSHHKNQIKRKKNMIMIMLSYLSEDSTNFYAELILVRKRELHHDVQQR